MTPESRLVGNLPQTVAIMARVSVFVIAKCYFRYPARPSPMPKASPALGLTMSTPPPLARVADGLASSLAMLHPVLH
jgi:hypothetical protein